MAGVNERSDACRYVGELEANEASSAGWDVLFYGDSIMEEWR